LYKNTVIGILAVDGWDVTFGTADYSEDGTGRAAVPPERWIAVPNVTAHPSVYQLYIIRCGTIIAVAV